MTISTSVVGVGLNVNQERFEHGRAASMRSFSGKAHALQDVLDGLLPTIERRYLQLRQGKRVALTEDYHQSLYGLGEVKRYRAGGVEFEGVIVGVDEIGRLRVKGEDGEKRYGLKEIEVVG
jgi:BirA family biotin operon repressor/biotin-[acetyl-CoA-carboxylase] ligase